MIKVNALFIINILLLFCIVFEYLQYSMKLLYLQLVDIPIKINSLLNETITQLQQSSTTTTTTTTSTTGITSTTSNNSTTSNTSTTSNIATTSTTGITSTTTTTSNTSTTSNETSNEVGSDSVDVTITNSEEEEEEEEEETGGEDNQKQHDKRNNKKKRKIFRTKSDRNQLLILVEGLSSATNIDNIKEWIDLPHFRRLLLVIYIYLSITRIYSLSHSLFIVLSSFLHSL